MSCRWGNSLVVKHTFLEYVESSDEQHMRARAHTDTQLLPGFGSGNSTTDEESNIEGLPVFSNNSSMENQLLSPATSPGVRPAVVSSSVQPPPPLALECQGTHAEVWNDWRNPPAQASPPLGMWSPQPPMCPPGDMQGSMYYQPPWYFNQYENFASCPPIQADARHGAPTMSPTTKPMSPVVKPKTSKLEEPQGVWSTSSTVTPTSSKTPVKSDGYWSERSTRAPAPTSTPVVSDASWSERSTRTPPPPARAPGRSDFTAGTSSSKALDDYALEDDNRTTIMLRNLPSTIMTRSKLLARLDSIGARRYDFVYVPVDFSTGCSLGYAFVNVSKASDVTRIWAAFDGLTAPGDDSKVCTVSWSTPHQGLATQIQRYRNSPVLHANIPDEWKPALFMNGKRVQFPAPSKPIKAPKVRSKARVHL